MAQNQGSECHLSSKAVKAVCLILIVASVGFRIAWAVHFSPNFGEFGNRYKLNQQLATNLITQGFYSKDGQFPNVGQEPVYPVIIAVAYFPFGRNWIMYLAVQTVIAGIGAYAVYRIAMICYRNKFVGMIAGTLFFAHPYVASQSPSIADTQLFATILALLAWAWLSMVERKSTRSALVAGLVLAVSLLTRTTVVSIIPALILFSLMDMIELPFKVRLKQVGLALACAGVAVSPWVLRNWYHTGQPILATHGMKEIGKGNNDYARDLLMQDISIDKLNHHVVPAARRAAEKWPKGSPRYQLAFEEHARNSGLNWAIENPGRFLSMVPLRLQKMWTWNITPKPVEHASLKRAVLACFLLPITILGLAPILIRPARGDHLSLCYLILLLFSCAAACVFGFTRLRTPFDTFLIVPASGTIVWMVNSLYARVSRQPSCGTVSDSIEVRSLA